MQRRSEKHWNSHHSWYITLDLSILNLSFWRLSGNDLYRSGENPDRCRDWLGIISRLQTFSTRVQRPYSFGAITRTCENRPCSKQWAIAQDFCSKLANFRPLRIQRKSTQTVAEGVRNNSRRVQEGLREFGAISRTCQKSAMFITMGYSPGFLPKNGQISTLVNLSEIDTNGCERS